jgi:1,2-diacylglycerol 3-alpha-glucosyltransferase
MRILIAGTTYYPALNGQSIFTVNLAEGLAKHGHQVLMVFPSDKGRAYRRDRKGVQMAAVRSLGLGLWHADAFFSPFPGHAVRKLFDEFEPEIVHIQDHYPLSRVVLREARRRGIKVAATNHFMPENLAPYVPGLSRIKPVYDWILWRWMLDTYNRVDVATAQSQRAADLVRMQGLRVPIFPVSCGIDLKRFHPDPSADRTACRARYGLDPKRTIFLFVGRVDGEKKIDVLLRALSLLERDDIQLAIAGRGSAMEELKALAASLQLGERVHFTGFVPNEDLHVLLNSVDIFTMPSEAELLSLASLEAMASARPVLLANAVALPELVTPGVNGYLFRPSDPVDAARCIALLANHPERWAEMGQASLKRAKYHGLDNTLLKYELLYEALLADDALSELQEQVLFAKVKN